MRARLLGLRSELARLFERIVAQGYDSRQRQALCLGRLAEELGDTTLLEELSPRGLPAQQLAELCHHYGRGRVELGTGIENHVDAVDVAGENQEFGEENARSDVGRRLAHRSCCGGHRVGEIAFVKEAARLAAAGSHRGRI